MAPAVLELPTLADDVVALRAPEARDVDQIVAACQDPDIPRYTRVPTPYGRSDAEDYVRNAAAGRAAGTDLSLVIVGAADDSVVLGAAGVHRLAEDRSVAEVGYWIESSARRRGIATRALRLVSRWVVADLAVQRLELLAATDNTGSHRVAEAAGFTREGVLRSYFRHRRGLLDITMFSLLPSDL
jgi:RimJ/RimL family protein N-acetyltransferase